MKSTNVLQDIADQVLSATELEIHLALDSIQIKENYAVLDAIRDRLCNRMRCDVGELEKKRSRTRIEKTRADLQIGILSEINEISQGLLQSAHDGFMGLGSSSVKFHININNRGNEPDFNEFDFQEFPRINYHGEALKAALEVRKFPIDQQLDALRYARNRWQLDSFDLRTRHVEWSGSSLSKEDVSKDKKNKKLHQQYCKSLNKSLLDHVDEFYSSIEPSSLYPYALPIQISTRSSSVDLRFTAQAYRDIGSILCIPFELRLSGSASALSQAHIARGKYESAGMGFRVLSAWIKAVDLINDQLHCSICYRHASAISRCDIHATKTQETREARLGKRVQPIYRQNMLKLSQFPSIRTLLNTDLSWSKDANEAMLLAADQAHLTVVSRDNAIVLANQLRELVAIMNQDIKENAELLFEKILETVRVLETKPAPKSDYERTIRDEQKIAIRELLSLKGFFNAWCGKGQYSRNVHLKRLGFDRDNPVANGSALAINLVPRAFLAQRAWTEALQEFKDDNLPEAEHITLHLRNGKSKQQIAEKYGIGLSTVYSILKRGPRPRKRNYFGKK